MLHKDIEELCSNANEIFIKESQSGFKKTRFLPVWLDNKAKLLRQERRHYQAKYKRKYKVYPRGAMVFVNFGVNVGAELSNHHWAIVLNGKDSPNSQKLTVVPISSKGNRFSVKIDGLISDKSEKYLTDLLAQKQNKFYEFTENSRKKFNGKYDNLEDFNHYMQTTETYFRESDAIKEVATTYQRFNKTSYAMCMDITTISKDKVMYLNDFDPSGKIKVSNHTLDAIEEQITKNLFKNL